MVSSWLKGLPGNSEGKDSACNAGDLGSICGLGRSPGEGNGHHCSILAWRIPWTEELGRPQPKGSQGWTRLRRFEIHFSLVVKTVTSESERQLANLGSATCLLCDLRLAP